MKILKNNKFWLILMLACLCADIAIRIFGDNSNINYIATCFAAFATGIFFGECMDEKK